MRFVWCLVWLTARMASYRQLIRAACLRPVRTDTRVLEFVERCRAQARAVTADDSDGAEIMDVIEALYEWPEA